MNIIFYCQYVWGMGHLFRSIEFARALSDHKVTLIAGGQAVDVDLPDHVNLLRLPVLYMDEKFTTLISGEPGKSVAEIQRVRKEILFSTLAQQQPHLFIVELYPFGRSIFGFELGPVLQAIREGEFGPVKSVCSLRDILVEKKHPDAYESHVLKALNTRFDLLLVHSDANLLPLDDTFSRVGDINIPVHYTGFITADSQPDGGIKLRQDLGVMPAEKLIVASAGGGRSGFQLLKGVLNAYRLLKDSHPLRLEVFTGPFAADVEFEKLKALATSGCRVRKFTNRFLDYLHAADLSISLAGYNTCMNLLVTKVPALVCPYSRQREQPMRVEKIKHFIPMQIISEADLNPVQLSNHIKHMLSQTRSPDPVPINLAGAPNAAAFLKKWIDEAK